MNNFISQNKLLLIGIVIGAIGGFLYWKTIGCDSGQCAITSQWQNSTTYGAIMGGLFFSFFKKENNDRNNE